MKTNVNSGGTGAVERTMQSERGADGGTRFFTEAEPWPESVDGAELLNELAGMFSRHVVLPGHAAEALALWVLHTYAFELREVTAYVGVESPEKRCGKTTLLSVLGQVVNRPVVAANISSPAFFRVIEETRPTLVIDETDTFLQGNEELRGILNSGYSRDTAFVVRVVPVRNGDGGLRSLDCGMRNGACGRPQEAEPDGSDDKAEVQEGSGVESGGVGTRLARFSCWCPKVMAAIGRLPDTVSDRCITVRMQRKMPGEKCERVRKLAAGEVRRKCARFVKDHAQEIAVAQPRVPEELNDRAADLWEPLLALAELAGPAWAEKARAAAIALTGGSQERNPISSLLMDILAVFAREKGGRVFSRKILGWLSASPDRPWATLRKGRELTEMWLAQQLKPYGVQSRTIRIGEEVGRGYMEDEMKEVFRRYITKGDYEEFRADLLAGSAGGVVSEHECT
jgi:hypothetical protein